jgi:hypothetical protein
MNASLQQRQQQQQHTARIGCDNVADAVKEVMNVV